MALSVDCGTEPNTRPVGPVGPALNTDGDRLTDPDLRCETFRDLCADTNGVLANHGHDRRINVEVFAERSVPASHRARKRGPQLAIRQVLAG